MSLTDTYRHSITRFVGIAIVFTILSHSVAIAQIDSEWPCDSLWNIQSDDRVVVLTFDDSANQAKTIHSCYRLQETPNPSGNWTTSSKQPNKRKAIALPSFSSMASPIRHTTG